MNHIPLGIVASARLQKITAIGGNYNYTYDGYKVHVFTQTDSLSITSGDDIIEAFLLGGGGGGASDGSGGGGGGAGAYVYTSFMSNLAVGTGSFEVIVGFSSSANQNGYSSGIGYTVFRPGGTSTFVTIASAIGGGKGGLFGSYGGNGGSGGGGGAFTGGGFGISGQGSNGGSGGFYNGGGGGGGGSAGATGNASPNETGGNGGSGLQLPAASWGSVSAMRAGGGGGGGGEMGGNASGGSGGGGTGRGNSTGGVGDSGTANTGSGGGGGYYTGGAGGSGLVVVRYRL